NGCSTTRDFTITEPGQLVAVVSAQTNVLCYGGNTGEATVSVTGGTPSYTYSWNTVPAQTGATATGLAAGNYTVTVTDANQITTDVTVTITESGIFSATITPTGSTELCED